VTEIIKDKDKNSLAKAIKPTGRVKFFILGLLSGLILATLIGQFTALNPFNYQEMEMKAKNSNQDNKGLGRDRWGNL
jgi:hypothetical protein